MGSVGGLQRKPIVDKNGKATTVYTRVEDASSVRSIPRLAQSPEQPPTERFTLALSVADAYGETIEVKNLGAHPHMHPVVSLADMHAPEFARGNCWSMTQQLLASTTPEEYGGEDFSSATISCRGINHTALIVYGATEDDDFIVDFTARQFSDELPYPLITSVEDWPRKISEAHGAPFEWQDEDETQKDADALQDRYDSYLDEA